MNCHNMKIARYSFLDRASVSENQRHRCPTWANDLTYNSMKAVFKPIFGDKINASMNEWYNGNSIIKEESAMVFGQSKNPKQKSNRMDKQGKITT